jgi:DNA-binding SARP family transcriptional activator/Tfp pilus assembly protein PilF
VPVNLEFRLLGPLQMVSGTTVIELPGSRQHRILALLVLRSRQLVSVADLVAVGWDDAPPATARRQIHTALWQLRRVLDQHGGRDVLVSQPAGYRLDIDHSQIDICSFDAIVADARRLASTAQLSAAADRLDEALALWRGPALAGLVGPVFDREAARLEELRLVALEDKLEYELACRDRRDLVAELSRLIGEHPLRERFAAALMLALYRADRQAEALQVYQRLASALAEELGIDPSRHLADRYTAILRRDPGLLPPDRNRADDRPAQPASDRPFDPEAPRPAQLPMDVRGFAGRESELARLDTLMSRRTEGAPVVVLSAISGTAGVGKTALAIHWAHRRAGEFPDGHLYVDLRGYDPDQPVRPADALTGLLRALGVAGSQIPADTADRAALYRSVLAGRRVLVLLDNAASPEQVRPLLPGAPTSSVLITSRDRMAGLVAREGADRIDLDLLPADDAVALLRGVVGSRVDAAPAAAAVLAAQCARLPLALRVAAELVVARPDTALAELTDELAARRRLDWMDAGGDSYTAVRAVFSWSFERLPPGARRTFRRLGLHPGVDVDVFAASALTGDRVEATTQHIRILLDAHLLRSAGADRYGMHDLLRVYAVELAADEEEPAGRHEAITRLMDHYADTAAAAFDVVLTGGRADTPDQLIVDPTDAVAWFDAERSNLIAVCEFAVRHGWPDHVRRIAAATWRYLDRGGHYADALTMHSTARAAALATGNRTAEADALINLGVTQWRHGAADRAIDSLTTGLTLSELSGDELNQARALANLGIVEAALGRYENAASRLEQALPHFDRLGHAVGKAGAHNNLAVIYIRQERYDEATAHLQETLRHSLSTGDSIGEAHARTNLGRIATQQCRYAEATEQHELALASSRANGDQVGEALALCNLGEVLARQDRFDEAFEHQWQALERFRAALDQNGEADALNTLAETLHASGRPEQAVAQHNAALTLASRTADQWETARAHTGLGHAYRTLGDLNKAGHHWRRALALYESSGLPQADPLRQCVAPADRPA